MANHRARAQSRRAGWPLGLLLPLWGLQLALAMATMALSAWRLGDAVRHGMEGAAAVETPIVEFAWEASNLALSSVAAACTVFEMGKRLAESLTPWVMVLTHGAKLACALAMVALDVAVYAVRTEARYAVAGLGLDATLTATAAATVGYALVTHRRLAARDDDVRPANVKGYGFRNDDRPSTRGAAWAPPSHEETPPQAASKRGGSYDHRRDTQFDDYVARRFHGRHTAARQTSRLATACTSPRILNGPATVETRSRGPSCTSDDAALVAVPEEDAEYLDDCRAHRAQTAHPSRPGQAMELQETRKIPPQSRHS